MDIPQIKSTNFYLTTSKSKVYLTDTFLRYLEEKQIEEVRGITFRVIYDFVVQLGHDDSYQISSKNQILCALRSFVTFLNDRNYKVKGLSIVKGFKEPVKLPKIIKKEEVDKLFAVVANKRDLLILNLLFWSALRISELHNLNVFDVDLDNVFVQGSRVGGNIGWKPWALKNFKAYSLIAKNGGTLKQRLAPFLKFKSDIDIAVRVTADEFENLLKSAKFFNKAKYIDGKPNAAMATYLHAIKTGKITSSEAMINGSRVLRTVRIVLEKLLKLQKNVNGTVDISIIKIGGEFDNGQLLKLIE